MINTRMTIKIAGSTALDKQTTFALASALTATAKEIQAGVIQEIESGFTVRTGWDKPSNIFGVRIKPATKQDLSAWIGTAADWLEKFVQKPAGSFVMKTPAGDFLAIPTKNVKRTKREIITKAQRPRALVGKRDFVIVTKRGVRVLFQRKGRGKASRLVALYILVPRARIREKDFLGAPTERIFARRFGPIFEAAVAKAFATAR